MASIEEARSALVTLIKGIIKKNIRTSVPCSVISVSGDPTDGLMTCDCKPLDGSAIIEDVQLCANFTVTTTQAGFLLIPSVDSIVTVSFKTNEDAFVSMVSLVDKIYLNGNDYGGLVEVLPLITKLNNLENLVNKLVDSLNTWIPVSGDGGAALKALITTAAPLPLTPSVRADIENTNILHGASNLT